MNASHEVALTLWPATPLPATVAEELLRVSVDLRNIYGDDTSIYLYRTSKGQAVLQITLKRSPFGMTDFEGVLATLRLADLAYVVWDTESGAHTGVARSFDPRERVEREFAVSACGEPLLTAGNLAEFERYGTVEALLRQIRHWLTLPAREFTELLNPAEMAIVASESEL